MAGGLADVFGMRRAIGAVGALTFLSGLVVATVMYETRRDPVAAPAARESLPEPGNTWRPLWHIEQSLRQVKPRVVAPPG